MTDTLPREIARVVAEEIRSNFIIDGVVPLTTRDLHSAIPNLHEKFEQAIRASHASIVLSAATAPSDPEIGRQDRPRSEFERFNWGDGLITHAVPMGWSFPNRATPKALWDLWYFGNQAERIGPYRHISREHDLPLQKDKLQYSRTKKVIEFLTAFITPAMWPQGKDRVSQLSPTESDQLFSELFQLCLEQLYSADRRCRRSHDVTVGRIYNLICEKNNQERGGGA